MLNVCILLHLILCIQNRPNHLPYHGLFVTTSAQTQDNASFVAWLSQGHWVSWDVQFQIYPQPWQRDIVCFDTHVENE